MAPSLSGVGTRIPDLADGASHTVLMTETMETSNLSLSHTAASRWTVGQEVFLCGMAGPSGTTPGLSGAPVLYAGSTYYAPPDFNGQYGNLGGTMSQRSYLAFNFPTIDSYEAPSATVQPTPPIYGPSSGHPSVVNHLMGDGSVQALNKDLDIAAYFFLITKANGDPFVLSNAGAAGN
jgi:hypothetical protein